MCAWILVHSAGVSARASTVDTELETIQQLLQVNFTSAVALTKGVLPSMRSRDAGSIVLINSVEGKIAAP